MIRIFKTEDGAMHEKMCIRDRNQYRDNLWCGKRHRHF